jgi:phytoene dehydrogenase-like protein
VPDVIVIGAGLHGLVTAAYLARGGRRVVVLERRELVGGTAVTEEIAPGFRCDTVQHDVGWLPRRIAADLELGGVELIRTDPAVVTPLGHGRALQLSTDPTRSTHAIRALSPADAARWPEFHERMTRLASFLEALYGEPAVQPLRTAPGDLLTLLRHVLRFRRLGRRGMVNLLRILPMSVAELLDDWFQSDALKGTLAAGAVAGNLLGPRSGGTAFGLLHHLVGNGTFRSRTLVRGGVGTLALALAAAARRYGAEIRTGADVTRILVKEGRVTGVVLASGDEVLAATVVSAADPRRTLLGLVEPIHLDPDVVEAVRHIRFRGPVAKVNLALAELPRFAGLSGDAAALRATVSISPSLDYLERAYDDAKHGGWSRQPYCEVRIPTLHDPALAPPGKHVMSVLVQYAPYHLSGGWTTAQRDALGNAVVATLAEHAPNVPGAMLHRQVLTPKDLEETFGLTEGSLYHGELSLDQILFMRPVPGWSRYRTPLDGLYLCGPGTHPGGGIAGLAGYNAARTILQETKGS